MTIKGLANKFLWFGLHTLLKTHISLLHIQRRLCQICEVIEKSSNN